MQRASAVTAAWNPVRAHRARVGVLFCSLTGTVAAAAAAEQNGAVHAGSETAARARVVTVTARVTAAVTGARALWSLREALAAV